MTPHYDMANWWQNDGRLANKKLFHAFSWWNELRQNVTVSCHRLTITHCWSVLMVRLLYVSIIAQYLSKITITQTCESGVTAARHRDRGQLPPHTLSIERSTEGGSRSHNPLTGKKNRKWFDGNGAIESFGHVSWLWQIDTLWKTHSCNRLPWFCENFCTNQLGVMTCACAKSLNMTFPIAWENIGKHHKRTKFQKETWFFWDGQHRNNESKPASKSWNNKPVTCMKRFKHFKTMMTYDDCEVHLDLALGQNEAAQQHSPRPILQEESLGIGVRWNEYEIKTRNTGNAKGMDGNANTNNGSLSFF